MTTISFTVQGRHTVTTGEAVVVERVMVGVRAAAEVLEGHFETRKIGEYKDGFRHDAVTYKIYENYQDSGSEDYFYFAIPIEE